MGLEEAFNGKRNIIDLQKVEESKNE